MDKEKHRSRFIAKLLSYSYPRATNSAVYGRRKVARALWRNGRITHVPTVYYELSVMDLLLREKERFSVVSVKSYVSGMQLWWVN